MHRQSTLPAVFALLMTLPASAADVKPFTPAALQAAQDTGRPVVLDVSASWCSTCKAQKPIVAALLAEPKYRDLVVLDVDFDKQKALMRRLNVREQSTFVAYRGKQEVGRSTGDTDKASIDRLFEKTR